MTTLELTAETIDVDRHGRSIVLSSDEGANQFILTPEECVTLSRALVHAAAEALGVKA